MQFTEIIQDDNHRVFSKYCNTLRCPLCNSQLDGNVNKATAYLYCVTNNAEYSCKVIAGQSDFQSEQITYWYTQWQYAVCINKTNSGFHTQIIRSNMDAAPEFRYKTNKVIFKYDGNRLTFFRSRMEENVFLKKLKIYNMLT